MFGIELPVNMSIDLEEGQSDGFYKKGEPHTYQAGIVDESISLTSTLAVNDSAAGAVDTLSKGDSFSLTGTLDTAPIREMMDSKIDKYQVGDLLNQVQVSGTSVRFTAAFTLPEGTSFNGNADSVALSGSDAFEIADVKADGNQILVTMDLKDASSITNLQQLHDIANAGSGALKLTVDGCQVTDAAAVNTELPVSALVNGDFNARATFENGAYYDIHFAMAAPESSAGVKIIEAIPMETEVDLPASITVQDNLSEYSTRTETPFALNGAIDTSPIKDKLKELLADHTVDEAGLSEIRVDNADVTFDAVFNLPEGMEWTEGSNAELTGSDAFAVTSVSKQGTQVRAQMTLKDPASIQTLKDLTSLAESASQDLTLKVEGFTLKDGAYDGQKFTVTGSVGGVMKADVTKRDGTPVDLTMNFRQSNTPSAAVSAIAPVSINETLAATSALAVNDRKPGEMTDISRDSLFSLTGTMDTTSIKDKLNSMISDAGDLITELDKVEISNPSCEFTTVISLPQGVAFTGTREDVLFSGSDAFEVSDVQTDGQNVTVKMSLKNPSSITSLKQLSDIASSASSDLKLTLNKLSAKDVTVFNQPLQFTSKTDGSFNADAGFEGGELYSIHFDIPAGTANTSIRVREPIDLTEEMTLPADLSVQDQKHYETYPQTDFYLTGTLNVSSVKDKLDEMIGSDHLPSDELSRIELSGTSLKLNAVLSLPEGISWNENSEITLSGADDFTVSSASLKDGKLTAVLELKDPSSIRNLADLSAVLGRMQDTLSLKVSGFQIAQGTPAGTEFEITSDIDGALATKATTRQGLDYNINLNFNGEGDQRVTVKTLDSVDIRKDVTLPTNLTAGEKKEENTTVSSSSTFPLSVSVDTSPMQQEIRDLETELKNRQIDPAELQDSLFDTQLSCFLELPQGVSWTDGSKAVLEGNSPFTVSGAVRYGNRVKVTLALKDPSGVKNLSDLLSLFESAPELNLKVEGFKASGDQKQYTINESLDGTIRISGKTAAGMPVSAVYQLRGVDEAGAVITVKPEEAKPATPSTPAKPSQGQASKPSAAATTGRTSRAATAFASGAAVFGSLLAASTAALAGFFRKNKKK